MRSALVAASTFPLIALSAHAESPWYVTGSVGGYYREDESGQVTIVTRFANGDTITSPGSSLTDSFGQGVFGGLALGYRLPARFRVEIEADYAHYSEFKLNATSSNIIFVNGFPTGARGQNFTRQAGADTDRYNATVNAFYDIPGLPAWVTPYVGGGIGVSYGETSRGIFADVLGNRFAEAGGSATRGVALVEGGVALALSDHFALVPAYRYFRYFGDTPVRGDEVAHVAKVGLRYSF